MAEWQEVVKNVWDFENEKEIIGVLVRKVPSQYGGNDFVLLVKDRGEILVYGKTVLQSKMNDLKEGTMIKIEYRGKETSKKSNKTYEDFKVYQTK